MKRIVIDARHINASTGVYIQNLLSRLDTLIANRSDLELIALVPSKSKEVLSKQYKNISFINADQKQYSISEQLSFCFTLYRLKPDLVHFCMPQQPLLYFGKRATTIHDLTLVNFENVSKPSIVYKVRKFIFVTMLRNVIARSSKIISPTQFVRQSILDFSHGKIDPKNVVVTLEAGDPLASSPEPLQVLDGKDFIFFIGNAFPYKNLYRIVDAFYEVQKQHPKLQLAFAGRKDGFYTQLEDYARKKSITNVHILGFVSESEKRWMFQNARAYVVASFSEGFHIPGLEAMYEGCPVVSANATCLPEVYGDAALYFDPTSTSQLADRISTILDDANVTSHLQEKGHQRVKKYSWEKMAKETLSVYDNVLGNK